MHIEGVRIMKSNSIRLRILLGFFLLSPLGCSPSPKPPAQTSPAQERPGAQNPTQPSSSKPSSSPPSSSTGRPETARASSLKALKLLEASRFDDAWEECQKVLFNAPNDARALYVSAEVLIHRKKIDQALAMVDRIAIGDPEYGLLAHRSAMNWCYDRSRVVAAEERALKLLERKPDDYETNRFLAALLDLQGRRFESSLIMQKLVRFSPLDMTNLVLAIDTVKPVAGDELSLKKLEQNPTEIRLKSSLAFGALYEKKPELAQTLFGEILQVDRSVPALWIGLGLSLIDQEKWSELSDWFQQAPKTGMEPFPDYWRAMGLWFLHQNKHQDAAKCFTKSLELDPMNHLAAGHLAQTLAILGDTSGAAIAERAFQETQLANRNLNYCRDGNRRSEWMLQIADTLESRGRVLEATLWREFNERSINPNSTQIKELESLRSRLSQSGPALLQTRLERPSESYPEIDWKSLSLSLNSANSPTNSSSESLGKSGRVQAKLGWTDVAKELHADILYRNGDDPKTLGMQTYQSNGAGAGVIDYDRDGWPDLFVLQGGSDPRVPASNDPNVLLRNFAGSDFRNVTNAARLDQRGYGQGVAVGDWDQDGLADLFVLNFGQNQLLRNQGDGTFEAIAIELMKRDIANHPVWSVSGAIADINGDGLPDLVEVNYASGIDVITHLCISKEKVPQVCRPTEFPASEDFIYLSDGQGGFSLANQDWNLPMQDGRGLGLIVGNLDRKHGNDIYIANDMSANNLYLSAQDPKRPGRFLVADEAVRRGCAVDNQGKPQASMGVGCADIDRNGTLDLFMTNFIDEYNALYLQNATGFFSDASRRYRLIDPKKKTLGFGAQCLDLDCDGWQDLMVVNGHVDDYRATGQPYTMRPEVFLQRDAVFAQQPNESLGEFFTKEYLSRSLGLWDFNCDGLVDCYITHLDHPMSILKNQTITDGAWFSIELTGTQSERDAIGAMVTVRVGQETWVHQRLAGNGFECSNEDFIHLGLGVASNIDSLEIAWPSGLISRWENIAVNSRYRAVEGQTELAEVKLR